MTKISPEDLPLARAYRWEKERANEVFLTQPMGGGEVRDWTWAQAMDESRRIAAYLRAQGWEPGSRIALMSKNTAWWVMSDLAIWMAGYVTVPIYPNLVAQTVAQILEHCGARLCIVGKLDDWKAMQPGIAHGMQCISTPLCDAQGFVTWDSIVASTAPQQESPEFSEDALATIVYTSGTTGMPKGAMHGFRTFAHQAKSSALTLSGTTEERMLSYLPLAHIVERALVEGFSIYLGSRMYFAESLDTFLIDLRRARPTFFISVPRLWVKFQQGVLAKMPQKKLNLLLSLPILSSIVKRKIIAQLGLESVRFAGSGAAPLPPETMVWYRRLGLDLLEGYGMTEQGGVAISCMPGQVHVGYVGSPVDCCEVKLSDSGELLTRGPSHMLGYFREPEQTQAAFTQDGWLKTGDLGDMDAQGRIRIVGRAKEQFKTSKGKYVAPGPIEGKLSAFTKIEACMVSGVSFSQPFAIAMLPPGHWTALQAAEPHKAFTDELAAHIKTVNAELDPHERLDFVVVVPDQWTVESGFVTPTFKLKRNVLEKHYASHFENWINERKSVIWFDSSKLPK
jgi:long-chain acyl-CoA synthetase